MLTMWWYLNNGVGPVVCTSALFLFGFFVSAVVLVVASELLFTGTSIFGVKLSKTVKTMCSITVFFPRLKFLCKVVLGTIILFKLYCLAFNKGAIGSTLGGFTMFLLIGIYIKKLALTLMFLASFNAMVKTIVKSKRVCVGLDPMVLVVTVTNACVFLKVCRGVSGEELCRGDLVGQTRVACGKGATRVSLFLSANLQSDSPVGSGTMVVTRCHTIGVLLDRGRQDVVRRGGKALQTCRNKVEILPFSAVGKSGAVCTIITSEMANRSFSGRGMAIKVIASGGFKDRCGKLLGPRVLLGRDTM